MVTVKKRHQNIVWIASYPKSGNTWVRFLLLNLLYGKQESSAQLDKLIPDNHKEGYSLPPPGRSLAYAKSHFKMAEDMPDLERTAGFIYIVRNPIDVMLSNLDYVYLTYRTPDVAEIREDIKNDFIAQFIRHRGDPRWLILGLGSWDEHVTAWFTNPYQFPALFIRYENLLTDTAAEMHRICEFLALGKTATEIDDAVSNSTFRRMRAIEDKEIENKKGGFFFSEHREQPLDTGTRFMNYGKNRDPSSHLSAEQREAILQLFAPTLTRLGYSLDKERNILAASNAPLNEKDFFTTAHNKL